ncbi:MAG TPA: hypothetical protein VEF03_06170 [Candidatus Binataceae bacterium]|nr:hypothetical protein [Candidatus Binataceae bacterium]
MLAADTSELYFLVDSKGALIAYQQNETSWAGILGFSSEERAREFVKTSGVATRDIASISALDEASIAALIDSVKKRAIRNLILDLDYRTGSCKMIEFEGARLGAARDYQFEPKTVR